MACVSQTVLNAVDNGLGNLTKTLRAEDMWDTTLMVLTADNGGSCGIANHPASGPNIPTKGGEPPPEPGSWTEPANNYPLRGRKSTPYDGGTRTTAFVSGGFIPTALRGTESHVLMHVADCTTSTNFLCFLHARFPHNRRGRRVRAEDQNPADCNTPHIALFLGPTVVAAAGSEPKARTLPAATQRT